MEIRLAPCGFVRFHRGSCVRCKLGGEKDVVGRAGVPFAFDVVALDEGVGAGVRCDCLSRWER